MPDRYRLDPHARSVLIYRWVVFLLAAGFVLRQIVIHGDYTPAGGPFRHLTVWALLLSFFVASRMLALTERRSELDWPVLVAVVAALNGMVVVLFWRLELAGDDLVRIGTPNPPYVDYYIHAVRPALQWFDALFVYGAIRRLWWSLLALLGLVSLYIAWVELFVGPANDTPIGRITEGLPYPFLNDLELPGRFAFYAQAAAAGAALLLLIFALTWLLRRGTPVG
ncbi:MAG: hypothetical protein KJN93_07725 [Alphaproteobacteria bacterium]|nr:hypothetical protein [Alphaproteobacteria bacterium]NNF23675.1 hypothetical protein [Paracoccaceae bacterium]